MYYKSGLRHLLTNYNKGVAASYEYEFYPNGKPYFEKKYTDINYNYIVNESYDSLGTVLVENGNGYHKVYDETFKYITEEGTLKNGKRDGLWKGEFKDIKTIISVKYLDGELITGTATDEDGKSVTYSKSKDVIPEFKGGAREFTNYILKTLR